MDSKCYKGVVTLAIMLVCSFTFASIPNDSKPKTFLGPTAHFGVVKALSDDTAFALAGEVGPKNYRASGTIGWEFDYNQRMKATAEYLRQKITYSFFDGTHDVWMQQGAIGLNYQYDFRQLDPFNTLIDMSAYYAHSPSKGLGSSIVTYNSSTVAVDKWVAGADAYGVGPGVTITTLDGTTAGVEVSYDHVQYDTKYRSALSATGLGGTVRLAQAITNDVTVGGSAALRKPYNNYEAKVSVNNVDFYGNWTLSAFGAYTMGKSSMPSTYNVGLGADYFIDEHKTLTQPEPKEKAAMPHPSKDYKGYKDYKDLPAMVWKDPEVADNDFLNWVSVPAVYVPQVYGVPDDSVVNQCPVPQLTGQIPDNPSEGGNEVIDLSNYFSGALLATYVVTENGVPLTQGVDPGEYNVVGTTLTIYHPGVGGWHDYVTIATNNCGTTPSNEFSVQWD